MRAATETVREIALESPAAIGVFEQFGINYCCGGQQPLAEACAANGVDVKIVLAGLQTASQREDAADRNWAREPLAALVDHIVGTHHALCKAELPRLSGLAARVVNQHGGSNPELPQIQSKLAQLAKELAEHLAEEEVSVFPMIVKLEREKGGRKRGRDELSVSVGNPLSFLTREHYGAAILLAQIRGLSRDFVAPEYGCATYHLFFDGLREFERDLHRHVHLENNILFPRAIELEAARG